MPAVAGVLSGLCQALDIAEGHSRGHAVRTALIGLELGALVSVPAFQRTALLHALLLKDAGSSANASRVHALFGGIDQDVKQAARTHDWRRGIERLRYVVAWAGRGQGSTVRLKKLVRLAVLGSDASREIVRLRSDRGAEIAHVMKLGEHVASALRAADEHWDGGGYPNGLSGEAIPLAARIVGIAQVMEIYWWMGGPSSAVDMVSGRNGSWFDPELVQAARSLGRDAPFWAGLESVGSNGSFSPFELEGMQARRATHDDLDRIAEAFASIIDGKSPYTADHSRRTAGYATAIARRLGLDRSQVRATRRVALVHDIGKLAVPNAILEKPGPLEDGEWDAIRAYPALTSDILSASPGFAIHAVDAGAHHERLDGSGYPLGLEGSGLDTMARVLAVADTIDAMATPRPYRGPLSADMILYVLRRDAGTKYCPACVDVCSSDLIEGGSRIERHDATARREEAGPAPVRVTA